MINNRKLISITLITILFLTTIPGYAQSSQGPRLAFAAYRNGQWDIYSVAPDGSDLHQLTNDPAEDTDPAYSPDGSHLAFASRRDENWDIYLLDLYSGQQRQLTNAPHYDGAPSWHPAGTVLAYESYQGGDLDIWQIATDGSEPPINLTTDSEAGEFAPAWSPDGEQIALTSWRNGNKDLFLFNVSTQEITPLTQTPTAEESALWHPNGNTLAFVIDNLGDREVFSLAVDKPPVAGGDVQQLTWLGRTDGPIWLGDDDPTLTVIAHRWDGDVLMRQPLAEGHQLPTALTEVINIQGRLTGHPQAVNFGNLVSTLVSTDMSALYQEQTTLNIDPQATESDHKLFGLVRQNDITTGTPWLADTVDASFQAWRRRIWQEVDFDFLNQLSDASRDVSAYSETSQYASWHKSGRAIDTLFDYHVDGQLAHELVKADYNGEIYWRIYLRCTDQSGRCGRPITANTWNYSARARTEVAPEQGGIEKANLSGYYIDMTALAREYGWEPISAYDDNDYSWTWHFLAFEYWHYQKRFDPQNPNYNTDTWYEAMQQIYGPDTLARYFTWEKMRSINDDPYLIALKGVPLPLEIKPWWALVKE